MYRNIIVIISVCILCIAVSCKLFDKEEPTPVEVYGCMDSTATNYNPDATVDDGSCDYCKEGASFIMLTTDGGKKWNTRCLKQKIGLIGDISMIDSNNIWLCTWQSTRAPKAQIMHTLDGGKTWIEQWADSTGRKFINYIEMFDLYNGIAMADSETDVPIFLKTDDGGKNWIQTTTQEIGGISGDTWRRLDFIDVNTGYFYESGVNPQKLYKTTNSGITWEETNYVGGVKVLKFFDEDIGIAVTGYGKIHRTLDGAETWEEIETTHTGWGMDIEFDPDDPSKILMLCDNLFYSTDTGRTWWQHQGSNQTTAGFIDLAISNGYGWLFGYYIYSSRNPFDPNTGWYLTTVPPIYPSDGGIGDAFDVIDSEIIVVPGYID
jgi:photosystem II stability/assembly factor-like uncharacterized protein